MARQRTPSCARVRKHAGERVHKRGHRLRHKLEGRIPVFGREEDAADDFATHLMLRFGDQETRALITGAALSYRKYVQGIKAHGTVSRVFGCS
jgi:pyruvate-formate lyase